MLFLTIKHLLLLQRKEVKLRLSTYFINKPILFGAEMNKGIVLNGFKLEVVTIGENGISKDDILVHLKEQIQHLHMLARMMTSRIS